MTSVADSVAPLFASTVTPEQGGVLQRTPPGSAACSVWHARSHNLDKFFPKFVGAGGESHSARASVASVSALADADWAEVVAAVVSDAEAASLFASVLSAFDNKHPAAGRQAALESCCGTPDVAALVLAKYLSCESVDL